MLSFKTFIKDLVSIKKTLIFAAVLFAAGIAAGWLSTGALAEIVSRQLSGLKEISSGLGESEHPQWSFFTFIFLNNSIKGVMIIYLGLLAGILPVVFLLINGMVIGYLVHVSANQGDDLVDLIVKGLLPHGIIEIPAIVIACAFGLQLGLGVLVGTNRKGDMERGRGWPALFRKSVTASFWIVILLFVAAIIESTLTYTLMKG